MNLRPVVLAAAVAVAGCTSTHSKAAPPGTLQTGTQAPLVASDHTSPVPAAGACHLRDKGGQPLPDPACTPGATNPAVTQATIGDTICVPGWATSHRQSIPSRQRADSARSYGVTTGQFEYDHLVSIELGGALVDSRNLWPEPGDIPNPKDAVENELHDAVCDGRISLAAAQAAIAADWTTAATTAGG